MGTLIAGTLAAVTGFGGAAILLPMLVAIFGVRDAVPILTVAQLIGNGSRVWFNRKELDWQVVRWFALGSIPAAIAGSLLFASAPLSALTRLLGAFLIGIVVYRHLRKNALKLPLRGFVPLGAVSSFLSALLGTAGPLMAPFFLAYGLTKGAYIGTEALASLLMHAVKTIVYGGTSILSVGGVGIGLFIGLGLIVGSYLGTRIVDKLSERIFVFLVEAALIVAGLRFFLGG
ncbi:MAG: sulfite exporter TauE/SafE family protein [Pirellulales bacterium]|nr:sulfite exporter TauE/SafE family protein [Pirellulales bacterium]